MTCYRQTAAIGVIAFTVLFWWAAYHLVASRVPPAPPVQTVAHCFYSPWGLYLPCASFEKGADL